MKRMIGVIPAISAALLAGCSTMGSQSRPATLATATLLDADGAVRGNATLVRDGSGLAVNATVNGLSEGLHGLHLHATGRCTPRDFSGAGGHLNPRSREHGQDNPAGAHLGDLPNVRVGADGTGALTYRLDGDRAAVLAQILDDDGTAIVVHAGPDDYRSDPAGNSGGRIACGVFAAVR